MFTLRQWNWMSVGLICLLLSTAPAGVLGQGAVSYRPLTYSAQSWYGSTFWGGPDWTRVGKDWHHPGTNTPSVRRFTVPRDGQVTITGRVYKLDTNKDAGDGVRLAIRQDDRTVWTAEIGGKDTRGVDPDLTLPVRRGEAIRFVVHARGTILYDTTHWDPVIAYPDGRRYEASAGFSTEQGRDGWSYEMEVLPGGPAPAAPLRVPDLAGLDLPAMVEIEWRREDRIDGSPGSYAGAIAHHLPKARLLLEDLCQGRAADFLTRERAELEQIAQAAARGGQGNEPLYLELRRLKRRIALANPLMDFGRMLFCKRVPPSYSHLVMQHFGWRARPGGGLFVLESPGRSLQARDLLDGKLACGNVLEPRLSYDGKRMVFSYVRADKTYGPPPPPAPEDADEGYYHIYVVGVDGTGLRQLTSGPYDDVMPTWLPDGGIAFCSTRRRGYARCFGGQFGQRWHVYTLHRVDADGGNLRTLSFHDTNEWYPAVSNTGHLLYARWDYIDRDAVTHQNLWACRPDGTHPVALWGNAVSRPHCSFQIQPIPGSPKIICTASAHHSITGGSLVMMDPSISNNGSGSIQRLTPEIPFPEAEKGITEYYDAPWPLSEKYFLVAYSYLPLVFEPRPNPINALGLYLLDVFGNRELIYRDAAIGSTHPCPLAARPVPPVLPSLLPPDAPPVGTMLMTDVYQGLGDVPRGSIKALRIIQILPKTTPLANKPAIGVAGEENARAILGTVPVEEDGSACFEVPARKPILFQAMDGGGCAYQTMRSVTYVQPGETVACIGCHENRLTAPRPQAVLALGRAPSKIEPGPIGGRPFSFVRIVQPVLDKYCVECHGGKKTEGKADLTAAPAGAFTRSYVALTRDGRLVPRFPQRNQIQVTTPGGAIGARGSGLLQLVRSGHYAVNLGDEDFRRLAAWIDCNAVFYGSYDPRENAMEIRGEPIFMPEVQ